MIAQDSSYDENALRVESHLGDMQIVRGTSSTVVARAGIFRGPRVVPLVSSSDSALAEAKVFERDYNHSVQRGGAIRHEPNRHGVLASP